ncbi:MAG TPA: serine/threonine-protein kinase, partial [Polyangiaceae bacterium]
WTKGSAPASAGSQENMSKEAAASAGKVLGRYQLLSSIARGGMGQVWLGRLQGARGFHKLVAIKTLLAADDDRRMESMLLEEARIAALIHHPNVVQTIELGEDEGQLYMVMEWVDGEPLSSALTEAEGRGGFPLAVSANIIAQTLRGLHAAHELCDDSGAPLGIVHRDVSPHNVLVTYTGAAKLLDFGIAKATKSKSNQTATGEVKGKFAYMAPEQILGTNMDRRTDLFAAGIMLYTLTAGRHPFKHHNDAGVLHAITSEHPATPPSQFRPDYPKALEAVVMKAIDKDITRRFATADEMRLALEIAVPAARNDADARNFVVELLGEKALARREAVRRILLRADAQTPPSGINVLANAQSGSLRGLVVDHDGRETSQSGERGVTSPNGERILEPTMRRVDSKAPLVRSRKRYQVALFGAVAIAAGALLFAARTVTGKRAAADSGVPAATLAAPAAVEKALPVIEAEAPAKAPGPPLPAAHTAEPAAPEAKAPAEASHPVPVERATPKAKRQPKPAQAGDDLIAPDYAK